MNDSENNIATHLGVFFDYRVKLECGPCTFDYSSRYSRRHCSKYYFAFCNKNNAFHCSCTGGDCSDKFDEHRHIGPC